MLVFLPTVNSLSQFPSQEASLAVTFLCVFLKRSYAFTNVYVSVFCAETHVQREADDIHFSAILLFHLIKYFGFFPISLV